MAFLLIPSTVSLFRKCKRLKKEKDDLNDKIKGYQNVLRKNEIELMNYCNYLNEVNGCKKVIERCHHMGDSFHLN
jgi:uncharacterized protein YeeX (DUF496 family)